MSALTIHWDQAALARGEHRLDYVEVDGERYVPETTRSGDLLGRTVSRALEVVERALLYADPEEGATTWRSGSEAKRVKVAEALDEVRGLLRELAPGRPPAPEVSAEETAVGASGTRTNVWVAHARTGAYAYRCQGCGDDHAVQGGPPPTVTTWVECACGLTTYFRAPTPDRPEAVLDYEGPVTVFMERGGYPSSALGLDREEPASIEEKIYELVLGPDYAPPGDDSMPDVTRRMRVRVEVLLEEPWDGARCTSKETT